MEPRVIVSTRVESYEDTSKVISSVRGIFPEWNVDPIVRSDSFPTSRQSELIIGEASSLDVLFSIVRESRTLDTAMDAMAMRSDEDGTIFSISRQSASIGKISFVIGESPLGGTIDVTLECSEIEPWLEQQTWHRGREEVPRSIGDEISMNVEGSPSEWFDSKGRKTMGDN